MILTNSSKSELEKAHNGLQAHILETLIYETWCLLQYTSVYSKDNKIQKTEEKEEFFFHQLIFLMFRYWMGMKTMYSLFEHYCYVHPWSNRNVSIIRHVFEITRLFEKSGIWNVISTEIVDTTFINRITVVSAIFKRLLIS